MTLDSLSKAVGIGSTFLAGVHVQSRVSSFIPPLFAALCLEAGLYNQIPALSHFGMHSLAGSLVTLPGSLAIHSLKKESRMGASVVAALFTFGMHRLIYPSLNTYLQELHAGALS